MPLVARPRSIKDPARETWLGGGYLLGLSSCTWPQMIEEARHAERDQSLFEEREVCLTSALSTLGVVASRRVAAVLAHVAHLGQRFAMLNQEECADPLLPDVEYLECPDTLPKQTLRLEGTIRSIGRGREDFTLTEAELAALLPGEVDE